MPANVLRAQGSSLHVEETCRPLATMRAFVIYTEAFQGKPRHGGDTEEAEAMESRDPTQLS